MARGSRLNSRSQRAIRIVGDGDLEPRRYAGNDLRLRATDVGNGDVDRRASTEPSMSQWGTDRPRSTDNPQRRSTARPGSSRRIPRRGPIGALKIAEQIAGDSPVWSRFRSARLRRTGCPAFAPVFRRRKGVDLLHTLRTFSSKGSARRSAAARTAREDERQSVEGESSAMRSVSCPRPA